MGRTLGSGGRWMSLLRRQKAVDAEIVGVPAASPGHPSSRPCSEPGCQAPDRVSCDYRDRRGAPCPTAWCADHVMTVHSWHLCRRHARVVQALAPVEFRGELPPPDLNNRAPSLASYLAEALDSRMRAALGELGHPANGEHVSAEALTPLNTENRGRRWAQGWKLFDNTGPLLRIDVEVDEARDPECAIRLNSRVILRCVPPWIQDRKAAAPPMEGAEDEKRRQVFYDRLMEQHVRPALVAEEHWVRRGEHSPNSAV
jgi:hypothetical protein